MKKILLTLTTLMLVTTLAGCNSNKKPDSSSEEPIKLNIASPSGAPALALWDMFTQSNVEINSSANNVIGYLSEDSNKDIVIAPTNALMSVIKKNAPYKIAATVTFGNFYIASTGNDDNETMDKDDYVVVFQQNGLPDKIFQYVYGNDFTNLHYVDAVTNAKACLDSGINIADNNAKVDYVMMAQPALAGTLATNQNVKQYADVQADYKEVSGGKEMTQASIFVRDSADKTEVNRFLSKVEKDVKDLLANPEIIKEATSQLEDEQVKLKFGAASTMLVKVLRDNSLGLGYKEALTNKSAIDTFLMSLNFTNEETSQNVYYQ